MVKGQNRVALHGEFTNDQLGCVLVDLHKFGPWAEKQLSNQNKEPCTATYRQGRVFRGQRWVSLHGDEFGTETLGLILVELYEAGRDLERLKK